jgi:hypothetical protein
MFIAALFAAALTTFFKVSTVSPKVFFAVEMSPILLANQSFLSGIFAFLIFILIFFLSIGLPLIFIVPAFINWRKNVYLRRHGAPAQAKILKIWDTGVTVNDNPQVGMQLVVYAAGRLPFQAETKSIVSRLQIPLVQVGSLVEVKYDRQDVSKVTLVI